jgi:hypothetical protein
VADKTSQLVLDALSRAVAEPAGLPLLGSKTTPGLFPATAAARPIAQRCKDEGYLRVVRTEAGGKSPLEICTLTEKGLSHLLSQLSPRQVLEDLVRALEVSQTQVAGLVAAARQWQAGLDDLKAIVQRVLQELRKPEPAPAGPTNGSDAWKDEILSSLARWQDAGAAGDHPLPDLFRRAQQAYPPLTIGQFHDALRHFHEEGRIYLHPWTGPLYDLPEPAFALLTGHEIAYYACLRG